MASAYVLATKVRPEVEFDPSNPEHRKLYGMFLKNNSWRHSPFRFITRPSYGIDKVSLIVSCQSITLAKNLAAKNTPTVLMHSVNSCNTETTNGS